MIYKDKPPISDNLVKKRINSVITQNGYDINIATIIAELYTYMRYLLFYMLCYQKLVKPQSYI